ncbi:hypothetical protein QR680_017716 [Steinernema hermaphroditum]|uniref:Uncharacterized protein n=1 Tax=Steinernema hermaphroditum TaxID=289476 RepID=A0AA39LPT2_9BILA|nr:hypothetical protein QR680_017716 [Steinernema hermaphroditum]
MGGIGVRSFELRIVFGRAPNAIHRNTFIGMSHPSEARFQNFWVDDEAIYGGFENDAEPVAICRVVDYRLSTGKISTAYFPREASSCTLSELYGDFSDLEEDDPPEESPPFRSLQNYGRKQTVAIDVDSRQITV